MRIQKKANVVKESEWEVVSVNDLPVPSRTRSLNPETQEVLDKVLALKEGQALKIPSRYVVEREVNGSVIRALKGALTVSRYLKRNGKRLRTRYDGNSLWVFVQRVQESEE